MSSDSDQATDPAVAVRRIFIAPLLILLAGALITLILYANLSKRETHSAWSQVAGEFKLAVHDRVSVIKQGIQHGLQGVHDIVALFQSYPCISRTSFGIFSQSLLENHPTTQALEWIPRVPAAERERYESQARCFFPDFRITERRQQGQMVPAASRREYFPVYFVEPYAGNEAALGFDLASEATRKAALEYCRDNNQLTVSGRIALVQEQCSQFGFLAFKPIYRQNETIETVAQRRRHLLGYALGVFRIGDLVETALTQLKPRGIDIWVFDDSASAKARLLYWHASQSDPAPTVMQSVPKEGLCEVALINVGDRQWRIHAAPAPGRYQPFPASWPKLVLWSGLLLSSLLAFYSYTLLRHAACLKRINDITERKHYEEQLEYQAKYDPLTGLVNRNLLLDRIEQAVAHGARYAHKVAVVYLDMDRFKTINDALGLSGADQVLKTMAQRLRQCVRNTDTLARIVSDEFVLILSGITAPDNVIRLAEHLLAEIARPLLFNEQTYQLTASIGISLCPDDGDDSETLLKHADMAMCRAKESGRNNFQFFTEELNIRVVEHLTLEADLRRALERDELVLHYQPQADLFTGRITGMEALIRWQHPRMGMVPPDRFISLAEQSGLICPIGEWVLNTACRQAKAWLAKGLPAVTIGVNLSAHQLRQKNLVEQVMNAVEKSGLPPKQLDLEITESMLMEHSEVAVTVLDALKGAGVSLSMDDFGTGYSSLACLRRFPFDTLKIDRSFMPGITEEPRQAAIVMAILSIAKSLNLKVVAEGVETLEQLNYLCRRGCEIMQGYYFSPALPPAEATRFLREDRRLSLPVTAINNDRTLLIVDDEMAVITAHTSSLPSLGRKPIYTNTCGKVSGGTKH